MHDQVIICVDDEKGILEGLNQQLNRTFSEKFILEFAQSGPEALELFSELKAEGLEIPFLITDQMMPGMKGSELILEVEKLSPNTKCILLTGYTAAEIIDNLPKSNLLGCLSKPWEGESLVDMIRSAASD